MKKHLHLLFIFAFCSIVILFYFSIFTLSQPTIPISLNISKNISTSIIPSTSNLFLRNYKKNHNILSLTYTNKENNSLINHKEDSTNNLKKILVLDNVPFIVQAPFSNWKVHQESCEEASILMVNNYLKKITNIDMYTVDTILKEMKKFQEDENGVEKDLYKEDLVDFAKKFYNYKNVNLIQNASINDIKIKLNEGFPVIVPVRARVLLNPNYRFADYHVLVAIGYNDLTHQIITNDPGTIKGEKYPYSYDIFESSMIKAGGNILTIEDKSVM